MNVYSLQIGNISFIAGSDSSEVWYTYIIGVINIIRVVIKVVVGQDNVQKLRQYEFTKKHYILVFSLHLSRVHKIHKTYFLIFHYSENIHGSG